MMPPSEAEIAGLVLIPLTLSNLDASNDEIEAPKIINAKNQRLPSIVKAKTIGIATVALRSLIFIVNRVDSYLTIFGIYDFPNRRFRVEKVSMTRSTSFSPKSGHKTSVK